MDGTQLAGSHFAQSAEPAAGPFAGGWNWRGDGFDLAHPRRRWSAFLFRADAPGARTLRLNVVAGGARAGVDFYGKKNEIGRASCRGKRGDLRGRRVL